MLNANFCSSDDAGSCGLSHQDARIGKRPKHQIILTNTFRRVVISGTRERLVTTYRGCTQISVVGSCGSCLPFRAQLFQSSIQTPSSSIEFIRGSAYFHPIRGGFPAQLTNIVPRFDPTGSQNATAALLGQVARTRHNHVAGVRGFDSVEPSPAASSLTPKSPT